MYDVSTTLYLKIMNFAKDNIVSLNGKNGDMKEDIFLKKYIRYMMFQMLNI